MYDVSLACSANPVKTLAVCLNEFEQKERDLE